MSTIKVNALRHTGGSSDNINLDSSGRVAIGTSTAGSRLQVNDDITTAYSAGSAPTYIARFENLDETTANTPAICSFRATGSNSTLSIWYAGNAGTTTTYTGSNFVIGNRTGSSSYAERLRITGTGDLQFNSGYGSVATAYGVRAWVNFQGTGTVAIRDDGNVSSITDNGTGVYRINFTTAMPDDNYSVVGSNIGSVHASYATFVCADNALNATGSCDIELRNITGSIVDQPSVNVIVCR